VHAQVALTLATDWEAYKTFRPGAHHEPQLNKMLDELREWGEALKRLRA
jgi:hypothetical protein